MSHFNLQKELAEQSDEDHVFGAQSKICISYPFPWNIRAQYLPKGEVQRAVDDVMDCATRAPINILETKFTFLIKQILTPSNRKWLIDNGYVDNEGRVTFSDAFIAIKSGTTRNGNSLKAPVVAIRKYGLIPKKMLPLESWMSFDDYHNPERITKDMIDLGNEFKKRFTINYERVYAETFDTMIDVDTIDVAAHAWPNPIEGEYPRNNGNINHAFIIFAKPMSLAFDNYLDVVDGDFVKKLAPDYKFFDYGYRVIISSQQDIAERATLIVRIINAIKTLCQSLHT